MHSSSASKNGGAPEVRTENVVAQYGNRRAVDGVSLLCEGGAVTSIIGPSGCGKSTLLRCINRLHENVPGARMSGSVHVGNENIYAAGADPVQLRRRVGMVFQRPTPFPTMTIRENVAAAIRVKARSLAPATVNELVERALQRAVLWDEVRDQLDASALSLSGGQQQRLCIARTLSTDPEVLLLDEPTASLDPLSTQRIEELVYELRGSVTVIIVTHNMQQAARVSDRSAFMLNGQVVEVSSTNLMFTTPSDPRTEAYVTGRFG